MKTMGYSELLENKKFRWLLASLAVVAPLEILSLFAIRPPMALTVPLYGAMILIFGRGVVRSGISGLARFDFSNINLLMTVAIAGAVYLGHLEEAVVIVVLFSLGETLEEFGVRRSQRAIEMLLEKVPLKATIKGETESVSVEEVPVGAVIVVRPGEQIPLDGVVVAGSSLVDEAVITGEPLPKNKYEGDTVFAGTLNGQGYLEIEVNKNAGETTLSRIIELTGEALEKKSRAQRFIERFAQYYTPLMLILSIGLVVVPVMFFGEPFAPWFVQALTLLIISCPCALVISTPVAMFSAIGNVTMKGALVKGGRFMEEMGKVRAIAFDKTRTLTRGEPVVADIIPMTGFTAREVLACAGGLEAFSEHPIAKSILQQAETMGVSGHRFENFQAVPGKGVSGECTVCYDSHHCMGSLRFVTEEHQVDDAVVRMVEELEKEGKTTIVITDDRRVKGIISVVDEIREESYTLISHLRQMGIVPVMLSGDNRSSAMHVAAQLGIKDVRWGLLPEEKVRELEGLAEQHGHVAMVGDGINDAPALAASSVGIAMGAIGSDVAIENCDIALMTDNISLVSYLVDVGRKCVGKIKVNVAFAIGVKFLFLALAVAQMSNLAMAVFADVGVTVLVILNSLRLYSYYPLNRSYSLISQ
ncbi:MAG: cation-translocating P-type ATPase [Deltaproteobacteria bacterium]|nr:cation-translocating P-type ATPase [Deltaproteobacteria bacterium]